MPRLPRATYRLQLNRDFTFRDALSLADDLARTGFSHLYLSPILMARPGSTSGYDTVDPTRLNPDLGTPEDFEALVAALRQRDMGLIVDIVPNHMGVGPENAWWSDVLARGRDSPYAGFFDIDWSTRILLPILGDHFGKELEAGRIVLDWEGGAPEVHYENHRLPIAPGLHKEVKSRLPELRADWRALGDLLERQPYRLAWWRTAADDLNYRRFFDIQELVGLRIEAPEVFDETHDRILRLVADGKIDGLRIDHIDGLRDPYHYLERLQKKIARTGESAYVVVEKILCPGEELRKSWPVAGTTGYDVMTLIGALFTDPAGERGLTRIHEAFTGSRAPFDKILEGAKRHVLGTSLASEVERLTNAFHRVAEADWRTRDFTVNALRHALIDILVHFSVYRTYVDEAGASAEDLAIIAAAVEAAKRQAGEGDIGQYDFIAAILATPHPAALRFQQVSGPVMAKGMEDTAFYRYDRLLAANEVGGDPRRLSVSLASFHRANVDRQARWPGSMVASSTHDTKRGEDGRARLVCLSGMTREWRRATTLSTRSLRRHSRVMPDRHDIYTFYQTLIAAWPPTLTPTDPAGLSILADRVTAALIKALREGKERSSWLAPNAPYEETVTSFIQTALQADDFLAVFHPFLQRIAALGALTSLSQLLLKLTIPGIPDTYRGAELWELSLVDPDNRRPVDHAALGALRASLEAGGDSPADLLAAWPDGRVKFYVLWRCLTLRKAHPDLFALGLYRPLWAAGPGAGRIVAFARIHGEETAITVAPRFWPKSRADWAGTSLDFPAGAYENIFTGRTYSLGSPQKLTIDSLLDGFPIALLYRLAIQA